MYSQLSFGRDITEVSLGVPQPGFCERFSLGGLDEKVHLHASNSNLEIVVSPRQATRPVLLTEEVGQVNVCTVRIVVPWSATGIKRVGVEGYRCAYIQQQSCWFYSGHHLFG